MADAAWVALSLLRGVGGVTMRALLAQFGSTAGVLRASEHDLCEVRGVGSKIAQAIHQIDLAETQRAIERWQRAGVALLPMADPHYPSRLLPVPDLPPTLFLLGTLRNPDAPHIAVVGTRNPSAAAQHHAATIGRTLAQQGAVVVSGMALGVDGIALHAALEVPGSQAIGVLGSGVLHPYPPENSALAHMLRLYGALVCEVAPDAMVSTSGLVARNRIITGMADATIIVETSAEGGAMHAARAAVRQGRRLYAVESNAGGNRHLLANGEAAALARDLGNLLDVLG